jgi:hypothetical protein
MSSSDDEEKIFEDAELLKWAQEAPEPLGYDSTPSEEERIAHDHAVREHARRKPRTRSRYDTRGR